MLPIGFLIESNTSDGASGQNLFDEIQFTRASNSRAPSKPPLTDCAKPVWLRSDGNNAADFEGIEMKPGFIGTGAICEALIIGLMDHGKFDDEIHISSRSETRSKKLSSRYDNVTIHEENQSIVDQSDWVFISVLPTQAAEVIKGLNFDARQTLISIVAGVSVETVKEWAEIDQVHRIIPLPPIEHGVGPLPIFPPNSELVEFFNRFGTAVELEDESHFSTLSAASAAMAAHHRFTSTVARWIVSQGVPDNAAAVYASQFICGLTQLECSVDYPSLQELADECLTSGGLNEQVLNELESLDWFAQLTLRLDRIAERLKN